MTKARIIPERLRERIEAVRLSHSAIARMLGVKQPTVTRLATGEQRSTARIDLLAQIVETTPGYLTGETDDCARTAAPPPVRFAEPQMVMLPVAFPPEYALADMLLGMMRSMPDLMEPIPDARQAEIARELATLLPSVLARVRGPFRSERSAHDDAVGDAEEVLRGGPQAQQRA